MKNITKIACRTIGTLGMGYALYDAVRVANYTSRVSSQNQQAKYLENIYANTRTVDNFSYNSNSIQNKAFELRSKNPLPSVWGRIKGWTQGILNSLGGNLLTVACSACAILSKGILAKIGAIGLGIGLCYNIARNGFGLGKQNPMN